MSALAGRDKTALLVIDVQNGVVQNAFRRDQVIANINAAVAKARHSEVPVIWVQHSDSEMPIDSEPWQIVSELIPLEGESRIRKTFRSSFEGTELADLLSNLAVGHLIVCGAETNNCVRHTSQDALSKGFDVTLIADAHTTTSYDWDGHSVSAQAVIDEQNDNFNEVLPGRFARSVVLEKLNL